MAGLQKKMLQKLIRHEYRFADALWLPGNSLTNQLQIESQSNSHESEKEICRHICL